LTDPPAQTQPTRPQRLHDDRENDNDLNEIVADPLAEEEEHGRIGYGRLGEWTPYGLAVLIILTILVIAAVNWIRDDGDDTNQPAGGQTESTPVARGPAPAFSVTLVTGETVDLASYRGKVVVLNFWATWCGPCKEEMPALQELAKANSDDVVVLGIAEPSDSRDEVTAFAADLDVTYPLAIDTGDNGPVGEVAGEYKIPGYPGTYFINANGDIVDAHFGPLELDRLQDYVDRAKSTTA
jgi:thiol-disulfide isomerase/thioredoxin